MNNADQVIVIFEAQLSAVIQELNKHLLKGWKLSKKGHLNRSKLETIAPIHQQATRSLCARKGKN